MKMKRMNYVFGVQHFFKDIFPLLLNLVLFPVFSGIKKYAISNNTKIKKCKVKLLSRLFQSLSTNFVLLSMLSSLSDFYSTRDPDGSSLKMQLVLISF